MLGSRDRTRDTVASRIRVYSISIGQRQKAQTKGLNPNGCEERAPERDKTNEL